MGNRIRTRNSPDMLLGMILQFEFFKQKYVDEVSECSYEFNTRLFQSIPYHRFPYSKVLHKRLEDKSAIPISDIQWTHTKLQEQGLVLAALKNELRKLKGKDLDKEAIETHSVDPKVSKDNVEPITPKLLNKRTAHSSYIKHTQEEAFVLRDIVKHVKANYPQCWELQI
ncbi:hypothetical protein Tco_0514732 [Tanacetum coccineum]